MSRDHVEGWIEHLRQLPAASSHCHHMQAEQHRELDLDRLLGWSYAGWCGIPVGQTAAEHQAYIDQIGANTYFVWLSKSVAELYGRGEITVATWSAISEAIAAAHRNPEHHFRLLSDRCKYRFAVQDSYWDPGNDLGRPELFRPAYRINSWVMAHGPGVTDHNGGTPWREGFSPATFDDYLEAMEQAIEDAVRRGCVALKSALAYDRSVAFDRPDVEAARRAFARGPASVSPEDAAAFGDVVFHRICTIAGRLGLPVQVHLGLGILRGSRPMLFEPVIAAYPNTVFDLFHCGYPWVDEIGGLLHNYHNVRADLCWLPLISTTAAVRALHEYLDVARSADRILWGDDCWTGEEAYGARMAWEHVLAHVLSERVADGLCSSARAESLAERLMSGNVEQCFRRG